MSPVLTMASGRIQKVAQAIKEEVAQILQQELKDPRIGFVTVTQVKVAADLSHATIYFSLLEGQSAGAPGAAPPSRSHGNEKETLAGLNSAAGYIRRLVGERLRLRVTPSITFRLDKSIAENIRISQLLKEIQQPKEQ